MVVPVRFNCGAWFAWACYIIWWHCCIFCFRLTCILCFTFYLTCIHICLDNCVLIHLSLFDSGPFRVYFVICHNCLPFCMPLTWCSVCVIFLCHCCPVCYLALPTHVLSFPFPSFTSILLHDAIVQLRLQFLLFLIMCASLCRNFGLCVVFVTRICIL